MGPNYDKGMTRIGRRDLPQGVVTATQLDLGRRNGDDVVTGTQLVFEKRHKRGRSCSVSTPEKPLIVAARIDTYGNV